MPRQGLVGNATLISWAKPWWSPQAEALRTAEACGSFLLQVLSQGAQEDFIGGRSAHWFWGPARPDTESLPLPTV